MFDPVPPITAKTILREVADKHGIRVEEFTKPGARTRSQLRGPRAEASYRLRYERGFSFPRIASAVGYSDHTSVIHAVWLHREALGDPEAIEFLRIKRGKHLKAIRIRNAICKPKPKGGARCSLTTKMRERLSSQKPVDLVMALRYFIEWDGQALRWTKASGTEGKEVRYKISKAIPGQTIVRARILWIILTGFNPTKRVVYRPQPRPLGPKTVYCLGESLADYLKRVPEYGSQYRSPRRTKGEDRQHLPVLPPADAIERAPPPDARSSGPA